MSACFDTTIEREGEEIAVTVEYEYSKGCRGSRDSLGGVRGAGPPLEPDEPPEVEIIGVTDAVGTEYELTEAEADKFRTQCFDDEGDRYAAAMERHAEDLDARLFESSGRENVENHKESESHDE